MDDGLNMELYADVGSDWDMTMGDDERDLARDPGDTDSEADEPDVDMQEIAIEQSAGKEDRPCPLCGRIFLEMFATVR